MSKRLCKVCGTTPLHRDNTSGICKGCKKAGTAIDRKSLAAGERPETEPGKAPRAKRTPKEDLTVYERTDKEPKKPFVGLNLLVLDAVAYLREHATAATVTEIAKHMKGRKAFEGSKQDPHQAARWHAWHLRKKGFLRAGR